MHFIDAFYRCMTFADRRLQTTFSSKYRAAVNLSSPDWHLQWRNNLDNIILRQNCLEALRTVIASCVYFKRIFNPLTPGGFCWNCIFLTVEQPRVVEGNFTSSFLLKFLSIFVHIWGSIELVTLIGVSLERSFPLASHADVLRLITRSSPRTSAQRTGHIRSLAVSQSKRLCLSVQSWTLTDFDLTLHEKFVLQMFNILTYVRVAPATADVHIILEVPATDKIHIEDRAVLLN